MSTELIQEGSQSYALATGQAGKDRLTLQNDILVENSIKFLEKAGISTGKCPS